MAKVEYCKIHFLSTDGNTSNNGWYYTGTLVNRGDAVIPLIKCTESQLTSMFGNLPTDNIRHEVSLQYDTDFMSNLGIDLTSIVTCGIVATIDQFNSVMTQYGRILPSVAVMDVGLYYNNDHPKMFGMYLDYNTIPTGTIDGHGGIEGIAFSPHTRQLPRTTSNSIYENGGVQTTQSMGLSGVPIILGFTEVNNNGQVQFECGIQFQCDDDNIYTYMVYGYGANIYAYIARCPIIWNGNPARGRDSSLAYLIAKSDKTILRYDVSVINGTGGGKYAAGESVTIVAQSDTPGAIFARWEFSTNVDIQYGGTNTAAVSFLMPNKAVTATAVFIDPESNTRSVTVQNGSGTGTYEVGSSVTIVADSRENLYFSHWDVAVQGSVDSSFEIQWTYGGTNTASASFIMPDKNLSFFAAYVNASGDFPYAGGGSSTPSPSNATWNKPENDVSTPDLPNANASAVQAGLVSMFNPTISELQSLGDFLWSDNFITDFADNIKKLLGDPLDCIISLHLVPVAPSHGSTKEEVNFGMVPSGVSMYRISNQYMAFDCGTLQIDNYSGSFMDYSPHTKYQLYLPFIGVEELDADEITGKLLGVKYHIDLLTGACVAFVSADNSLIASYNGQCINPVPVSGANYSRTIAAILGIVATGVIAGASMGAGAGAVAMTMQNSPTRVGETVAGLAKAFNQTGSIGRGLPGVANVRRQIGVAIDNVMDAGANTEYANTISSSARALVLAHATNSAISDIMGAKGMISHSGNMGGSVGFLGKRTPYLITIRPNQSIPNNYGHFFGYPSNLSGQLSSFSGFTTCSAIEAKAISGTDSEMEELIELLKGGVYL